MRRFVDPGTAWIVAGMLAQQAASYACAILALRSVSTEVYGAVVVALAVASLLLPLAAQGLAAGATKFVAEHALRDAARGRAIFVEIKWLTLAGALGLAALVPVAHALLPDSVRAVVGRGAFAAGVGAWIVLSAMIEVNQRGLLGAKEPRLRAISGLLAPALVRVAATALLLPFFADAGGLFATYATALVASLALSEHFLRRRNLRFGPPRFHETRPLYRFALPLAGAELLTALLYQSDRVLLGWLAGPHDVAVYNVAARLAALLLVPYWATAQTFAPLVSEYWSTGQRERLRRAYRRTTTRSMVVLASLYALLAINAGWLLACFRPEFDVPEARLAVRILGAGMLAQTLPGLNGVLYRMTGRTTLSTWTTGWTALLCVGLNVALIPPLGLVGAAVATASSFLLANLAGLVLFRTHYAMAVHPFGPGYFAGLAYALALAVAAQVLADAPLLLANAIVALAIAGGAGVLLRARTSTQGHASGASFPTADDAVRR